MPRDIGTPNTTQCLVAGGLAGMAVDTALYPLDTIKTRLQAHGGFLRSGGFRGVYSGLSSAIIGSSPGAAMFFLTYEQTKTSLAHLPASQLPLAHMLAGSLGEIAACLVRVPTEVLKQRLQAQQHRGLRAAVRATYATEGVLGFYRGYLTQVVREIPFTCIQFPLYEYMKTRYARSVRRPPSAWEAAVCGSVAGATAAAVTTPLDVVKTRVMLSQRGSGRAEYSGIWPTLLRIAREEGPRALFSGIVPRTVWISIGGFVFLGSYEKAKATLLANKVFSNA
ncbi:S-adenosylmethionine transporter [Coemansia interrupta]|uniref:S-adenosylmethionine transporter n=1 Tax=Coemansia interrupta TaxID=1126814 RepID=A0A9W8H604_9FUNG|nr:S-adenosylmethionine transporter [Coemansia interrupta]